MSAPSLVELAKLPALAPLSGRELKAAARFFTVRTFTRNAIIATEGDGSDYFNFILSGDVQAFWRDDAGHHLKLGVDTAGMHFPDHRLRGEPALVSHVAASDVRLASIRLADWRRLMRRHPEVTEVLLLDVVSRLRRMLARTKMLTMNDVYGRVVKQLLAASVEVDGRLVTEPLTHAEIGQRVGATREMVGRIMRDLARGGYIEARRGRVTLLRKLPVRW